MKEPGPATRRTLIVLGLLSVAGIYAWSMQRGVNQIATGMGDYTHFYHAARAMLDGKDIYASGTGEGYIYPPLLAFLYQPLAWFDFDTSCRLWLVIGALLSLLATWVGARECVRRIIAGAGWDHAFLVFVLITALMTDKVRAELRMGQTNVILFLMMVLAMRWIDRRPSLAGLALGLAFNIKYLPIVLLPWMIVRRRWAAAGWYVGSIVLFTFLPSASTGWGTNLRYLGVAYQGVARLVGVHPVGEAAAVQDIRVGFSLSVTSMIARHLTGANVHERAIALGAGVSVVAALVMAAMYLVRRGPLVAWPRAGGQREQPFASLLAVEWSMLIVFALAFSPQTNMRHAYLDFLAMLPAGALLVREHGTRRALAPIISLALGFVGLNWPVFLPRSWGLSPDEWRLMAGPAWAMLAAQGVLLWGMLSPARGTVASAGRTR